MRDPRHISVYSNGSYSRGVSSSSKSTCRRDGRILRATHPSASSWRALLLACAALHICRHVWSYLRNLLAHRRHIPLRHWFDAHPSHLLTIMHPAAMYILYSHAFCWRIFSAPIIQTLHPFQEMRISLRRSCSSRLALLPHLLLALVRFLVGVYVCAIASSVFRSECLVLMTVSSALVVLCQLDAVSTGDVRCASRSRGWDQRARDRTEGRRGSV
jgi:hypothetical protein